MNKLLKIVSDAEFRFNVLSARNILFWMSDKQILEKKYKYSFGKKPDFDNPKTYSEKLQWLKLYDRKPIYSTMVDKHEAKRFIAEKIGEEYVVPTIAVWDSVEDIDFSALPDKFVLKCTHDSGGLVICHDKKKLDVDAARRKIKKSLKHNYYYVGREWPYKNVKPRVIAEAYLEDVSDGELRDYKFFTFSGKPQVFYIAQGRSGGGDTTADFFDMELNHLDLKIDHENADIPPHPPENFELMKRLATVLSEGIPQLRVDFYEVNGRVYVGELTFFHCGGLVPITPGVWEKQFADWVELPATERNCK